MATEPQTLLDAVRRFSDLDLCEAHMIAARWADGKIVCPSCGGENIGRVASRRKFQCRAATCRRQFSAKIGTIFEDSPLGLDQWFVAVWCIAHAKSLSSHELGRALGVTQPTAWSMLHRIRMAMRTRSFRTLGCTVDGGEAFDSLLKKLAKIRKAEAVRASHAWKKTRAARKKPKLETHNRDRSGSNASGGARPSRG